MAAERFLKFIFGLVLVLLALYLLLSYWLDSFLILVKGIIPVVLVFIGIIFLLLSFEK